MKKNLLETLLETYNEFFLWMEDKNKKEVKFGHVPLEPTFNEFMAWLDEVKLRDNK